MINIFYHKRDLDGYCSGAIAKYFQRNTEVKMWPFDYGDEFPFDEIEDGSQVTMLDITTNPYELIQEVNKKYKLTVIDHHKSFINSEYCKNLIGVFEDGTAACILTWEYFFPGTVIPAIVNLLGKYDVWDNENKTYWNEYIMPMQMGMRMQKADPSTDEGFDFWEKYFDGYFNKGESSLMFELERNCLAAGKVILEYQETEDAKTVALYAFEAEFEGMKALCLNSTRFSSQVYESIWDNTKYDIMLAWANSKGQFTTVSLYTDKEGIDVSKIAKKFGGGGHIQAAGFQCKTVNIHTVDNNKKIILEE